VALVSPQPAPPPLRPADGRAAAPAAADVPPQLGPRVQLTFADGSSAALDVDQARALDEIAQLMTGRDGVKH
jgi:ABC-type cobalamin transport system ATPase subunit